VEPVTCPACAHIAILARTSHRVSSRGGADGLGYKAHDEGPCRQACSKAAGLDSMSRSPRKRNAARYGGGMPGSAAGAEGR
jgi:hypothetical protein